MLSVRILGTMEIEVDGHPLTVGSPKQRLILALLTGSPAGLSRDRLVDALWGQSPPPSASATVMGYISRLRGALGASRIEGGPDGYRLHADVVDARRFEELVHESAHDEVPAALEQALALWRGDAFAPFGDHPLLVGEARRLHELRTAARLTLATRYLEAGDVSRPASMLEAVVSENPLREDAWVLLVRALRTGGRTADAVRAASRCRRALAEIGLEPSRDLVDAEAAAFADGRTAHTHSLGEPPVGPVRYARYDGIHLAYQVVGGGPVDLVLSSYGSISIDSIGDDDHFAGFVDHLASECRVILYDTRGVGLSDPIDVTAPPSIDEQARDLAVVLEDAHATHPVVVGVGDGGPTAIVAAHRDPDIVGLVLVNTFATLQKSDDYPYGIPFEQLIENIEQSTDHQSDRDTSLVLRYHAPSVAGDLRFRRWWERAGRRGASPATAAALWRVRYGADVRGTLTTISTPTLVIHRRRSRVIPLVHGAFLAEHIPGASFVEIEGADQPPFTERAEEIAHLIVDFALARRRPKTGS